MTQLLGHVDHDSPPDVGVLPCQCHKVLLHMYESAGLLQGSCSSVVRAPTAKVGGLGLDTHAFFLSVS